MLYFNTNKPHSFFFKKTSCIRKPQVMSRGGGGGAHPLLKKILDAPLVRVWYAVRSAVQFVSRYMTYKVLFVPVSPLPYK